MDWSVSGGCVCLTRKCSGRGRVGTPGLVCSFFRCVSPETHRFRSSPFRGELAPVPQAGREPRSRGLRSGIYKPLGSVVGLKPRGVPCSEQPGTEVEEKEPGLKVKRHCWRCPWLCRADVKCPASRVTSETPRVLQMGWAGCRPWRPLALVWRTFCFNFLLVMQNKLRSLKKNLVIKSRKRRVIWIRGIVYWPFKQCLCFFRHKQCLCFPECFVWLSVVVELHEIYIWDERI